MTDHLSHSIKEDIKFETLMTSNESRQKSARIANIFDWGKIIACTKEYEERTRQELYQQAKEMRIAGRSNMNKGQLIYALRHK